jgi:hypothetical protein
MSKIPCVNCGEMVDTYAGACHICGAAVEDPGAASTKQAAGLHPFAPAVFAVAAIAVGVTVSILSSPALGIPLGLVSGGIGVWMLERGRRLTG